METKLSEFNTHWLVFRPYDYPVFQELLAYFKASFVLHDESEQYLLFFKRNSLRESIWDQ